MHEETNYLLIQDKLLALNTREVHSLTQFAAGEPELPQAYRVHVAERSQHSCRWPASGLRRATAERRERQCFGTHQCCVLKDCRAGRAEVLIIFCCSALQEPLFWGKARCAWLTLCLLRRSPLNKPMKRPIGCLPNSGHKRFQLCANPTPGKSCSSRLNPDTNPRGNVQASPSPLQRGNGKHHKLGRDVTYAD